MPKYKGEGKIKQKTLIARVECILDHRFLLLPASVRQGPLILIMALKSKSAILSHRWNLVYKIDFSLEIGLK